MAASNVAWGIDIGTSAIKAVKMVSNKDRVSIAGIEIVPFELTGEEIDRNEQIRAGIASFLANNKIAKTERVFVSLPGQAVFNRTITLPPVEAKRLPEIVKYEAQQQIPFPIDDVIWDYQLVSEPGAIGEMEVILFAIKKEVVQNYLANLSAAGLNPQGVQISSLAMYNFALYDQPLDPQAAYCCIDVGAGFTNLVIIQGKRMWLRNVPIAGNDITKVLQDKFQVPFKEAEKLKLKANKSKEAKKIFEVMKPVLRDLVGEVQRSIGFYKAQQNATKIEKILVMGNSTHLINFKKFLSSNLQYEVDLLTTLQKVPLSRRINLDLFEGNVPGLTVAIGLGIQALGLSQNNVRLVTQETVTEDHLEKLKKPLIVAVILLGILTVLAYLKSSWDLKAAKEIANLGKPLMDKVKAQRAEYEQVKVLDNERKNLNSIITVGQNRNAWVWVTEAINKCLPDNATLANEKERIWFVKSQLKVEDKLVSETKTNPDGTKTESSRVEKRLKVTFTGAIRYEGKQEESLNQVEKNFLSKLRTAKEPGSDNLLFSEVSPEPAKTSEYPTLDKAGTKENYFIFTVNLTVNKVL